MISKRRKFLQDKVIEHFEKSSDIYSMREGAEDDNDEEIIKAFKENNISPANILEVGGGSGYLINLLGNLSGNVHMVNCELTYRAYSKQINDEIDFVAGNAISLPFHKKSFDVIVSKNLFHHLVGKTPAESKSLAKIAVDEMIRCIKDEGYLMIVEEYHRHKFYSGVLFYLSLLFSVGNITIKAFDIRPKVIISLLTPNEFESMFESLEDGINITQVHQRLWDNTFRLPLLKRFPRIFKMGYLVSVKKITKTIR